jgi:hypothetical protein
MSAGITAATAIGLGVGAAASIGGALITSSGAQSAANTQASAANNATDAQTAMYQQTVANEQPYMNAGNTALSTLNDKMGALNTAMPIMPSVNNTNWQQYISPAYNFQLQQGDQALQNSQAAQDGALSGSALKGLINYNQNFANTAYTNAMSTFQNQYNTQFNEYQNQNQNIYGRLAGLAQLGQNAASSTGMTGAGMAGGIANTITGAGNAQAAGTIGSANAITGGINNGMGYYMMNNLSGGNLFGGGGNGYTNPGGVPGWSPSTGGQ